MEMGYIDTSKEEKMKGGSSRLTAEWQPLYGAGKRGRHRATHDKIILPLLPHK